MELFDRKGKWTLAVQEGLPDDIHKKVAQALGEGIINDDFADFESLLDKDVRWEWQRCDRAPIAGSNEVIAYWKDWAQRVSSDELEVMFEVKFCTFYSRAVLSISPKGYATTYVLFYIQNGLVKLGAFANKHVARVKLLGNPYIIKRKTLDDIPFALRDKDIKEISVLDAIDDGMPCLDCGRTSAMLSWSQVVFGNRSIEFVGKVSKCPNCGKVVEFVFEEESALRTDNISELGMVKESDECLEMTDDTLEIGLCYTMPLKDSEYIASLSKKKSIEMSVPTAKLGVTKKMKTSPYKAAAEFMKSVLYVQYMRNYDEYERIKNCYIEALNNGVYEAANNLGILIYTVESLDQEKAFDYFMIAAEHNSTAAFKNLVKIYWQEKRYEDLISFLRDGNGNSALETEGNVFQRISKLHIFKSYWDYTQFIHALFPEIKLDCGWYISVRLYFDGDNATGEESYFYVANSRNSATYYDMESASVKFEGEHDFDIWKHVIMPRSERAIWELYLLMNANTVLPFWWHGGYRQRIFIFGDSDFAKIPIFRDVDLSGLKETGYTHPSVEIEDCAGGFCAHVYCCYWNKWKGIIREHVVVKVQEDRVVEYKKESDFVIYSYNCGILY